MRVLQINTVYEIGSTGRIVADIHNVLLETNHESYIIYGYGEGIKQNTYKMQNSVYLKYNILKTRIWGKHGFYNKIATLRAINKIEEIQPDIIHLHNIHGHYLNVEVLFKYLKRKKIPVIWTLHDCWSFTGHCAYFDYVKCLKWKDGCGKCEQLHSYPKSLFFDRSKEAFIDKKELFLGVDSLHIVTPSDWLAELVKQSYLCNYPISVINNGIDLNKFKPYKSTFREKYNLQNKRIILGVAMGFDKRKGYQYFLELAHMLDEEFRIILIGVEESQKKDIPKTIITLPRTNSVTELAKMYTLADVFVNPTLEDNFPTVNLEALACGTPVITFRTGGSIECIDENVGRVVDKGDINQLYDAIVDITKYPKAVYAEHCIQKAKEKYDKNLKYQEYIKLYEREIKKVNSKRRI